MKIRLTVHGQPRPAPSTTRGPPRDFASLLPLILNMHDLFAREKPGQFARPLNPRKGQATYQVGDLALRPGDFYTPMTAQPSQALAL